MRLDKFLKVSRLIKRRSVANEACDSERISVNGKNAKASYDVKLGDKITVAFGNKSVTVRVLEIKDTTKKTEAQGMYEVISETEA
jgi:ribosomal 50S subunit-recycling heat shock protein